MDYRIQKLGVSDIKYFQQLIILFANVFEEKELSISDLPEEAYLKRMLEKQDFHVLVALGDDRVIGGVTGYELELYSEKKKEMYLYDLAVDEGHRKKGVGRSLITSLKEIAQKRAVSLIFVEAHAEDTGAIEFYRAIGAEMDDVRHFNIHLDNK